MIVSRQFFNGPENWHLRIAGLIQERKREMMPAHMMPAHKRRALAAEKRKKRRAYMKRIEELESENRRLIAKAAAFDTLADAFLGVIEDRLENLISDMVSERLNEARLSI